MIIIYNPITPKKSPIKTFQHSTIYLIEEKTLTCFVNQDLISCLLCAKHDFFHKMTALVFYFEILKLVTDCYTTPLCNIQKQQKKEQVRQYECGM